MSGNFCPTSDFSTGPPNDINQLVIESTRARLSGTVSLALAHSPLTGTPGGAGGVAAPSRKVFARGQPGPHVHIRRHTTRRLLSVLRPSLEAECSQSPDVDVAVVLLTENGTNVVLGAGQRLGRSRFK